MRLLVLRLDLRPEVDPLEHERAEREHRLPHVRRLPDVVDAIRRRDDVAHERVDALGARRPEHLDLVLRKVFFPQQAVAERVVDVVVDVRDAVDEPHDLALERRRLALPGVGQDPVADLERQVERACDPMRLLVVPEPSAEPLVQRLV